MLCPTCKQDFVVCKGLKSAYGTIYQGVSSTDYIEKCVCTKCGHEFEKPMDKQEEQKWR